MIATEPAAPAAPAARTASGVGMGVTRERMSAGIMGSYCSRWVCVGDSLDVRKCLRPWWLLVFGVGCILFGVNGTPIRQAAGGDRHAQIAQLRARMAELGGDAAPQVVAGEGVLSVPGGLAQVLPGGGLPRRAVTQVSDTPALVVELLDRVAELSLIHI